MQRCFECGVEVALSDATAAELGNVQPVCMRCVPGDQQPLITPGQVAVIAAARGVAESVIVKEFAALGVALAEMEEE